MSADTPVARLNLLWRRHVAELGCADTALSSLIFNRLVASYGEPHRAYHTLEHLEFLFAKLNRYGSGADDRLRLWFAGWYHDVVYDPRASDNEARSAERAKTELALLGASAEFQQRVAGLILSTAKHREADEDEDGDLFLDCDFSILGADDDLYRAYAAQVRQEYVHLDDAAWKAGRSAFLTSALAERHIFRTFPFELAFAWQARANMRWELDALAATG
jgi:predicted metal-dependent HD superfamily phosphohydrolase